MFVLVAF